MSEGMLRYHLDQLAEAELVEITGFNYLQGHTYWGITAKGRKYVVEHGLEDTARPDNKAEQIRELVKRVQTLESENARLRAQNPSAEVGLKPDTIRVLVHMFEAEDRDDREVGLMATRLGMKPNVLKHHLEELEEAGLAHPTGADIDGVYWALKSKGRKYVMDIGLNQLGLDPPS